MHLCKDCDFYRPVDTCLHDPEPVTGKARLDWRRWASLQRDDGWFDSFLMRSCGRRGRWFKPKT